MTTAPSDPVDRPDPAVGDEDCGGDPPCWEGRIIDHRDDPVPAEPDDA